MKRIIKRSTKLLALITGIMFLLASCVEDDIMVTDIALDQVAAKVRKGSNNYTESFLYTRLMLQIRILPGDHQAQALQQ